MKPTPAVGSATPAGAADTASLSPLKRAFLALEATSARLAEAEAAMHEPIAVIGIGCRVPGEGHDPESFWQLLRDGTDAIGPLPADRWHVDALYDANPDAVGRIATRGGGFLKQIDSFDPSVFGIARREAQGMDPQQRLLLEVCWEALEHAGKAPDRLAGTETGVYIGASGSDYMSLELQTRDHALLDAHFASGSAHSVVSGRVSYVLGLQGPSLTVDTACSSSLVAVHLACQALRIGDCRMALAGGVNLILAPEVYIALSRARMLSPDGRCRTFDAAADGFARGEGCGVVVLKTLRAARADGDRILAVIRGSAVNQDGASSGLTAPNGPAQEAVIREALRRANVSPSAVGYVEAHGTGTQLGDPLEVGALGAVFGPGRDAAKPLLVGSVKTNVGHLEAAAGITGLIKLVMALQHRAVPAHLHFRTPSPHIPWAELPIRVPTSLTDWEPIDGRRVGGVSSFGFSGTNAHVVIEEAGAALDADERSNASSDHESADAPVQVFLLSAMDRAALLASARRHEAWLDRHPHVALSDVCFTSAVGRAMHPERAAILARTVSELRSRLQILANGEEGDGIRCARLARRDPPRVAMLFTGQGSQYPGMGARLYAREPVFRDAIDACARALDTTLREPLRTVMFAPPEAGAPIGQTAYTQPALFALEYALAQLWRSWGITPAAVIGHSVGEFAAACVAGVMTLDDALTLIAERGRLLQALPPGGTMAAIFTSAAEVALAVDALSDRVAIGAVNGPAQTVISGASDAVDEICRHFSTLGVRTQRLPVSHAFHSPLVDPMLDAFERAASGIAFAAPRVRLISNVTGALATAAEITQPRYWRQHVRQPVRFADGLATLAAQQVDVLIEVGPHPALLPLAHHVVAGDAAACVPSLRSGREDDATLAESLGALFLHGAPIDWHAVWSARASALVDLPSYPFQRERLWFHADTSAALEASVGRETGHPLLGRRLRSSLSDIAQFDVILRGRDLPYLRDHQVNGRTILPGTGLLEMATAAAHAVRQSPTALQDVTIVEPLAIAADDARVVQVVVRTHADGSAGFEVASAPIGDTSPVWRRHAQGRLSALPSPMSRDTTSSEIRARCAQVVTADEHYAHLASRGLQFGESLRGVRQIHRRDGEAIGMVEPLAAELVGSGPYTLHPALLDACLQVMAAAIPTAPRDAGIFLPFNFSEVRVHRAPAASVWSHVTIAPGPADGQTLLANVTVFDDIGVVAELHGITMRRAAAVATAAMEVDADAAARQMMYQVTWRPQSRAPWIPNPTALAADVGAVLPSLVRTHALDAYHREFLQLEQTSRVLIQTALSTMGWHPTVGDRCSAETLAPQLAVVPRYTLLLGRFLEILAEDGLLVAEAGGWRVARAFDNSESSLAADQPMAAVRGPRVTLTARSGAELANILRGTADPLQQLFPGGSADLAESLYRDAPEAKAFNSLLRETVTRIADARPARETLRVLEVGGGTGGSTSWIAPVLPAAHTRYLFTDISPQLVARASATFAEHEFMTFGVLDLEQDDAVHALGAERYDLIVASNVVHATADIARTLARLRTLLAPGGTLLMLEMSGRERWIDITFGLTDGWWRFTDTVLRPTYPLLSRAQWIDQLSSGGFDAAAISAEIPESRQVLLAAQARVAPTNAGLERTRWLILADQGGVGDALAALLRAAGASTVLVPVDANGDTPTGDASDVNLRVRRLVEQHAHELHGVVHLWSLDLPPAERRELSKLADATQMTLGSVLEIVQALGAVSFAADATPRLILATRGAHAVAEEGPINPLQSPLWGLRNSLALEHPELSPACIDLDVHAAVTGQSAAVFELIAARDAERQVAVRGAQRYVARLERVATRRGETAAPPHQLRHTGSGVLDDLRLVPLSRRSPGRGEVEILVHAAGLNFRDVMNAVAMRDDAEPLGGECAGRVVAIGDGVTELAVGDDVVAIAEGSFASFAVADARNVHRLPRGVGYAQAATLPFAFMTAQYALHVIGGLRKSDTVLIHAGAGGVGSAAIQIALRVGATVVATAGSEEKRAHLRAQGVAHVLDSRTQDFGRALLAITNGRGADVILNSLAGPFIATSVNALADDGCFLEIGKRDIWTAEEFAAARPRARYAAIDLAALRVDAPDTNAALFARVMDEVQQGMLRPLPLHCFPLERASEAFRFMAQARHIGKIVLLPAQLESHALDELSPSGTYLITGGVRGLGLLTAARLVERGARHVVLAARHAPDAAHVSSIDALRATGARIECVRVDLADAEAVARMLDVIDTEMPPLRGIVHAAGSLEDGALQQQTWERFRTPLGPKVTGAWALHALSQRCPIDFFVMYSSVAAVLGSRGQANHAAANAFMDALASHRRALGLPALSISWGAWSEIGAAAERDLERRLDARGIGVIAPRVGLHALDLAVRDPAPHLAVFAAEWEALLSQFGGAVPRFLDDVRLRTPVALATPRDHAPVAHAGTVSASFRTTLRDAVPAQRHAVLLTFVAEQTARVLAAPSASAIDPRQPLSEIGLDSLMAVELRNRLASGLGLARGLPATLVFDHPTLHAIVDYLAQNVLGDDMTPSPQHSSDPAARNARHVDVIGAIDDLTDDEVDALFARRTGQS